MAKDLSIGKKEIRIKVLGNSHKIIEGLVWIMFVFINLFLIVFLRNQL